MPTAAVMMAAAVTEAGIEGAHAGMERAHRARVEVGKMKAARIETTEIEAVRQTAMNRAGVAKDNTIGTAALAHGVGERFELFGEFFAEQDRRAERCR